MSGLLHFFEVHIFTLVFGEDLFLLPSGVGFRGTGALKSARVCWLPPWGMSKPFGRRIPKSDKMKFRMRPKAMPKKTINPTTRAKRHPRVEFIR